MKPGMTLTSLKAHRRRKLIDPAIAGHHGRIVKTTGDGALAEFGSVVDAVQCAVAIQRGMLSRNAGIREDKRVVFRIGVNVGDIIIDDGDIFGDGVNIAARLQTLGMRIPGGLCISRAANDQIRDKLALAFADLGEQTVKNISRAIGIFGLAPGDIEALPEAQELELEEEAIGGGGRSVHGHKQEVHFCLTRDGVQLAYSRASTAGAHWVKTGNWMKHASPSSISSPIWRHLSIARVVARPLADPLRRTRQAAVSRTATSKVSFETFVSDLEASRGRFRPRTLRLLPIIAGMRGCRSPMRCAIPKRVRIWLYAGVLWSASAKRAMASAAGQGTQGRRC